MGILNYIYKRRNKYRIIHLRKPQSSIKLLGMLRLRNEELILEDTLNHLSSFCESIICFDDASTDNSYKILAKHPKVLAVIRNFRWRSGAEERLQSETSHRNELLRLGRTYQPEWFFYADADERYIGDIREFVETEKSSNIDLVRVSLYDAYLTREDSNPYQKGDTLLNFRTFFGPERRDIIMLWRNVPGITFEGLDRREPVYEKHLRVATAFYCQHYGKSLSIEHWEETCDYYINHFPLETYGNKWMERKGKAIHEQSDFSTPLYEWGEKLFQYAIKIYPGERE